MLIQTWNVLASRIGAGLAPFVILQKDSVDLWYIHYVVCLIVIILSLIDRIYIFINY